MPYIFDFVLGNISNIQSTTTKQSLEMYPNCCNDKKYHINMILQLQFFLKVAEINEKTTTPKYKS